MLYAETKGIRIPKLGLGTYQLRDDAATRMVETALQLGCTHIDTAQIYDNEAAIGTGLARASVSRDAYWLTTKVWYERLVSEEEVRRSVETSLEKLGVDHVDLLLIHWPHPKVMLEDYLDHLLEMQALGYTRHIGVSNFTIELLERAAHITPDLVNNQVEYHAMLDQRALLAACRRQGMTLTAYSPLAQGELVQHPRLGQIGEGYGRSAAQVALRWLIQQDDVIAIPKTSSPDRLLNNLDVLNFSLTDGEMSELFGLAADCCHRVVDPSFAPQWDV